MDLVAVDDRVRKIALTHEVFRERRTDTGQVFEFRSSPMPDGGVVVTVIDATESVLAWSMIWVPSTPLALPSPCGIASLAELSSRWTELKLPALRKMIRPRADLRVPSLRSSQRTPVTRRVAGS